MTYRPIIGLEVHVELATRSKMFCGCPADHFAKKPNTNTCPVCLGLPGALPVPNRQAVKWTILLGLALSCEIPLTSKFDRKNYFYPDLPKGYQISQYDEPLCINGKVTVLDHTGKPKTIRIRRVHMEEDTGKLMHETVNGQRVALVDLNRCGVPLTEIVTEPDFGSIDEVDQYVKKLQQTIRYLGISDADMEKGSMRLEPSISLTAAGGHLPAYRVEVKNINSFRFARRALEYEIQRQTAVLEKGEKPIQQTRGWSEAKNATVAQREKEEANDYRYFPEPDIPPMRWDSAFINGIKSQLPELPDDKKARFMKKFALNNYDAGLLTDTAELANYFEECVNVAQAVKETQLTPKKLANWIINKKVNIDEVLPARLVESIVKASAVSSISDDELENVIQQVIEANPKAVGDYKKGKEQAFGFLVGQIMKRTQGSVSVQIVSKKMKVML